MKNSLYRKWEGTLPGVPQQNGARCGPASQTIATTCKWQRLRSGMESKNTEALVGPTLTGSGCHVPSATTIYCNCLPRCGANVVKCQTCNFWTFVTMYEGIHTSYLPTCSEHPETSSADGSQSRPLCTYELLTLIALLCSSNQCRHSILY